MEAIGRRCWAIAEGYIPDQSPGPAPEFESHETACMLNAGESDAHVEITIYFTDREPVGPYRVVVPARRTLHLRFNELRDPEPVPRATDYASVIVRLSRSSSSTRGSTRGRPRTPCFPPSRCIYQLRS